VIGDRINLHKELDNLYSLPHSLVGLLNQSSRLRWAGHVACMGETRNMYKALVGKPEGKRPFGRFSHRWRLIK
jgi:hypothetical protein